MKPTCYNRPAFLDRRTVQDGYERPIGNMSAVIVPRMVTIDDPMSKGCQQWGRLGEARMHGWDCDGCKWKPEDTHEETR